MAARRAVMSAAFIKLFSILLVCTISVLVKKKCFISSDIIGLNHNISEIVEDRETFVMPTLWINKTYMRYYLCRRCSSSYIYLFLLLCGDVETCPGPENIELAAMKSFKGLKLYHHNILGLWKNFINVT